MNPCLIPGLKKYMFSFPQKQQPQPVQSKKYFYFYIFYNILLALLNFKSYIS